MPGSTAKGDFYASVRGPLGIELARILIVGNDIAAIDRFKKNCIHGEEGCGHEEERTA